MRRQMGFEISGFGARCMEGGNGWHISYYIFVLLQPTPRRVLHASQMLSHDEKRHGLSPNLLVQAVISTARFPASRAVSRYRKGQLNPSPLSLLLITLVQGPYSLTKGRFDPEYSTYGQGWMCCLVG
jgi:hypothetical protein